MTEFLVRYAQCDIRRVQVAVVRAQQEKESVALRTQQRVLAQKLDEAREQSRQAQQAVRSAERDCSDIQLAVQHAQAAVAAARSVMLCEHAEKELAYQTQLLSQAEERLLTVWDIHARAIAHEKQVLQEYTVVENQVRELQIKISDVLALCAREESQLAAEHAAILGQLPEQLRMVCSDLMTRFQNPILLVNSSSCGGCFSQLRPQDENLLERGHWIRCHGCTRILIYSRGQ